MTKQVDTQILVIGGGAAACFAAIEAAKFGLSTTLVDKGRLGRSGSSPASGGTGAATLKGTVGQIFRQDTMKGGGYLNNKKLLEIFLDEADICARLLENIGLPVSKEKDGTYRKARGFGESEWMPVLYVKDKGYGLMDTLRKEVLHRNVQVLENLMIVKLFTSGDEVIGAAGMDRTTGELTIFNATSIVVAAGGATGLFPYYSANFKTTGDAYQLLYDAGAELANMEFQEFTLIPTANGQPFSSGGINWTAQQGMFFNNLQERFMLRYHPEFKEKAPRGVLARAVYQEISAGRGPVMVDLSHVDPLECEKREKEEGKTHLLWKLRSYGIDYRKDRFQWVPAVHTSLGGAVINEHAETCVRGLFAAGESSGQGGVFGADRIGKALSACYVFGRRAGQFAARRALKTGIPKASQSGVKKLKRYLDALMTDAAVTNSVSLQRFKKSFHDLCWQAICLVRSGDDLNAACTQFEEFEKIRLKAKTIRELTEVLELRNLILTAKLVTRSAFDRKESRGQHYREDFPQSDPAWQKLIIHQFVKGEEKKKYAKI